MSWRQQRQRVPYPCVCPRPLPRAVGFALFKECYESIRIQRTHSRFLHCLIYLMGRQSRAKKDSWGMKKKLCECEHTKIWHIRTQRRMLVSRQNRAQKRHHTQTKLGRIKGYGGCFRAANLLQYLSCVGIPRSNRLLSVNVNGVFLRELLSHPSIATPLVTATMSSPQFHIGANSIHEESSQSVIPRFVERSIDRKVFFGHEGRQSHRLDTPRNSHQAQERLRSNE